MGWGLAATPCAGGFGVGADPSAPTATNSNFSVGSSTWLLLNLNVSGYFRVNYNQENWDQLLQQLSNNHQAIPVINRAQIIDDAFNLAR